MAGFDTHKNLAVSSVATPPGPATSGTSLVVKAGEGIRFAVPANATIWPANALPTPANAEIVRVTAVGGDTLTIVRGQEGSTARAIGTGDLIAATVTAKTLTDLETRAALKDESNTFTANEQIISAGYPRLTWMDTLNAAGQRRFDWINLDGVLQARALSDDASTVVASSLQIGRNGDVFVGRNLYEAARSTPIGHRIPVAYSQSNFSTYPAGTWTVPSANVRLNAYTLLGRMAVYVFILDDSTVTAGVSHLAIANPVPGAAAVVSAAGGAKIGAEIGISYCQAGDGSVYTHRQGAAAFAGGATGQVYFSLIMFLP